MAKNLTIPNTGLSLNELQFEVNRGARFIIYSYCISAVVVTFKRPTGIVFVKANENAAAKSLPYTLMTFALGWWGFPWGLIRTPEVIYKNLKGGTDVTSAVMQTLQNAPAGTPIGPVV